MIRIHPIQNGRRLEITLNRDIVADDEALDVVLRSLSRSKYESHQAIAAQIERQCESAVRLIRFSLNTSAAARIENSLRWIYAQRRIYRNHGQLQLHEALCRVLDIRMSVAQGLTARSAS